MINTQNIFFVVFCFFDGHLVLRNSERRKITQIYPMTTVNTEWMAKEKKTNMCVCVDHSVLKIQIKEGRKRRRIFLKIKFFFVFVFSFLLSGSTIPEYIYQEKKGFWMEKKAFSKNERIHFHFNHFFTFALKKQTKQKK